MHSTKHFPVTHTHTTGSNSTTKQRHNLAANVIPNLGNLICRIYKQQRNLLSHTGMLWGDSLSGKRTKCPILRVMAESNTEVFS